MEVEVDAQAVLARPADRLEDVCATGRTMVHQQCSLRERASKKPKSERVEHAHSHATPARKGSPSHVSMAHQPNGMRTQFRPAPAISAKSFSVCAGVWSKRGGAGRREGQVHSSATQKEAGGKTAHDEGVVVLPHGVGQVRSELLRQSPLVDGLVVGGPRVDAIRVEGLEHAGDDEGLEDEPAAGVRPASESRTTSERERAAPDGQTRRRSRTETRDTRRTRQC